MDDFHFTPDSPYHKICALETPNVEFQQTTNIADTVEEALNALNMDHSFHHFKAPMTKDEIFIRLCAHVQQSAYGPFQDPYHWHVDNPYEAGNNDQRVTIPLKGPSTLIYDLPKEHRELFFAKMYDYGNKSRYQHIIEERYVVHTELGVGTAFLMGRDTGTVHASPQHYEQRIVLLVDKS